MLSPTNALFSFKTPIKDMYAYPVGDQLQYCFKPEIFTYGLLSIHPIGRTFVKDNKQFWREVAKANIKAIKLWRGNLAPLDQQVSDGEELSSDQSAWHEQLTTKITTHTNALTIARQRSATGFGLQNTTDIYAKRLRRFYIQLVQWERGKENNVFKGNVVEDALGIIQKRVYFTEPHEGNCGINNGELFKTILADINTNDEYKWLYDLAIFTEQVSDRLSLLVKGTDYVSPSFTMMENFHN